MSRSILASFGRLASAGTLCAALFFGFSPSHQVTTPLAQDVGGKSVREDVQMLAKRIAKKPERLWVYAYEIGAMAAKDTTKLAELSGEIANLFDSENEEVRLAAATLTLSLGGDGEALAEDAAEILVEILSDGKAENVAAAARTLKELDVEEADDVIEAIQSALEDREELDGEARIALSEAEYYYGEDELIFDRLKEWSASEDESTARWASLSLAQQGKFNQVAAKIREIGEGAGPMATLARIIIENEGTKRELNAVERSNTSDDLVTEAIGLVKFNYNGKRFEYADEKYSLSVANLLDSAYRGMASSLDRYSAVMTTKEYKKDQESNNNSYAGIGAYVTRRDEDNAIRISAPIYSGPAYKAGLRSGDLLWACQLDDGEKISLDGLTTAEGIKILRGPVGTKVKLWVKRYGVADPVLLEFERAQVVTNSSPHEVLPGNIGYLKLKQFGGRSTFLNFFTAMRDLKYEKRAKGVILDLRGNPGGSLQTVMVIAGILMGKDKDITRIKGLFPPYHEGSKLQTADLQIRAFNDMPMVVLIDGSSASGSELLSGSLQDHKRATIIGEPSYGKGIGQSFYPITEAQTYDRDGSPTNKGIANVLKNESGRILKTTVFDYFILPSGRSIDMYSPTPSVRPDIAVHNKLLSSWEAKYAQKLRDSRKLNHWVRDNWEKHQEKFMALASYDGYSIEAYPGFDALYESLGTPLSKNRVKTMLRVEIRVMAADELGREFLQNYQLDSQLQRAIKEVAKKAKVDLSQVEEYRPFTKD